MMTNSNDGEDHKEGQKEGSSLDVETLLPLNLQCSHAHLLF